MTLPHIAWIDIIEILLIAVFVYQFMLWVRNTRAYSLLKGILIVLAFIFIAFLLKMNTILWLVYNAGGYAITAILVIFQPELRKALEELGHKIIQNNTTACRHRTCRSSKKTAANGHGCRYMKNKRHWCHHKGHIIF